MKIRESKNLKYDEIPIGHFEDPGEIKQSQCTLDHFHVVGNKIDLEFKNRRVATIRAQNYDGYLEIGVIENKLNDFIDKSYEEILNTNF
ncbi:hypothetical protein ACFLYY_02600 [Patescibacteria group bacterium]